jgi:hypothetical protein
MVKVLKAPPAAALKDPLAGYWNFFTGSIILMFVIYITAKGELASYIELFFYTPPGGGAPSKPVDTSNLPGAVDPRTGQPHGVPAKPGRGLFPGFPDILGSPQTIDPRTGQPPGVPAKPGSGLFGSQKGWLGMGGVGPFGLL